MHPFFIITCTVPVSLLCNKEVMMSFLLANVYKTNKQKKANVDQLYNHGSIA